MPTDKSLVLIVDDDRDYRESLGDFLRGRGLMAVEAPNGRVALDYLLSSEPAPSLVLLDLNMPEMTGQELLARMAGIGQLAEIPVVVISGEKIPWRDGGVVARLSKPYDIRDLVALLDRHTASPPPA
jgi:CheY-like chemotaxis protein